MIRYSLVCGAEHGFEAWFRDSAAFDDLNRDGLVACPECGASSVRKAMMAPAIRRPSRQIASVEVPREHAEISKPVPVALEGPPLFEDDRSRQVRALVREMHAKVKASAENVGAAFSQEARRLHDGEEAPRSIYGTATGEEVRSLIEDGVSVMPLPPLADERN